MAIWISRDSDNDRYYIWENKPERRTVELGIGKHERGSVIYVAAPQSAPLAWFCPRVWERLAGETVKPGECKRITKVTIETAP